MNKCAAVTVWPEVPPNGVRLACSLPAGHDGEHACAEIEYLPVSPVVEPDSHVFTVDSAATKRPPGGASTPLIPGASPTTKESTSA